jgi:hypothetical protein
MATITGTTGNDTIDNSAEAPESADRYDMLEGDDSVRAGGGNDSLFGGAGNDTLSGDDGNDSLEGEGGNDSLSGGAGNDRLFGGSSNDTLAGGTGADVLNGGTGLDFADYSASDAGVTIVLDGGVATGGHAQGDSLSGIDGIIGSDFDDNLTGFNGQGTGASDIFTNIFFGGRGNDTLDGRGSNDQLFGGDDNDSILGGDGVDLVSGDAGNDTVLGEGGADTVRGGTGNDLLFGGAGNDLLEGGEDLDTLFGGEGTDTLFGGLGNDRFVFGPGDVDAPGNDIVIGGGDATENPADRDILDLSAFPPANVFVSYTSTDPNNLVGTVQIWDGPVGAQGSTILGVIEFSEIEGVVCFTPGTRILTDRGPVAVEDLVAGDLVVTRDHGLQPLRWVGRRDLSRLDLVANPNLVPVRIARGALGAGPDRTMLVSPQHRFLVATARAELLFGEAEVLVPAKQLVGRTQATRALPDAGVAYIHILFDRHEIVQSDGVWSESFQPAERSLTAMEAEVRAEILALFPELADNPGAFDGARLSLKPHEVRVLFA